MKSTLITVLIFFSASVVLSQQSKYVTHNSMMKIRAKKNGEPVELSLKEFTFIEYLARRPGLVVPFAELCRVTHSLDTTTTEAGNLLYPVIRSLRRRLGYAAGEMGCIESVRGVGYRLAAAEQEA